MNEKIAMEQKLSYAFVKYGILSPGKKYRSNFPPTNKPFIIIAGDHEYAVHIEGQGRISFIKWFKSKGNDVKPGDIIRLYEIESMSKYSLEHQPSLSDEENRLSSIVTEDMQESEITSLTLEKDMKEILRKKLDQLEPGLKLYNDGTTNGIEVYADEGVGQMDFLALDKDGNFVVIECKASKTSDKVVGQINRYINWVKENLAKDKNVRGIIVANEFDESIKWSIKNLPYIILKKYEVSFKFTDA